MEKSPTATRYQLGRELLALRNRRGLSAAHVAAILHRTPHTVRRFERGDSTLSHGDLVLLLDAYGVADETARRMLFELREQAQQPVWWSKYGLTESTSKLVGFEDAATEIRMYELAIIPGPLQTEAYARAIIRAKDHQADQDSVERSVRLRMERQQQVYGRKFPPKVTVVLAEQAIRTPVVGAEAMAEQLFHMLKGPCSYELRIIPATLGAHAGLLGAFWLFTFDRKVRPPAAYVDGPVHNSYVDVAEAVRDATVNYEHLLGLALSDQDSRALVMAVIKELDK